MNKGTIAKIMEGKGYGFIAREGETKDLFFHARGVNGSFDDLREGDSVTFEIENGPKGPAAVNVTRV